VNAIIKAEHALTPREPPSSGAALYRMSSDAAGLCKDIVLATAQTIQGRKYVRVEGWQAIAIAHGCIASSGTVTRTATGYSAIGRVINMATGIEMASAEGFVGDDEKMWAARPEYACRAMAQTRAISRACRSAFAHVVVMMQAGLSTTPAEEMEEEAPRVVPQMVQQNGTLQTARTEHRQAQQAAAIEPAPRKQTVAEFLDGLDAELDRAPEASAVEALMTSQRVSDARSFLKNGAADRLRLWTERAEAKRQALADDEAEAAIPFAPEQPAQSADPETMPDPAPLGDLPESIQDWPMVNHLA
jgi:hypothetical protein